ncbi:ribosome recycling factor [Alkaliphilus metalliredigens QYMF]|uniref:Ribosome-recycling factor n=1 Tax=Alkaliphilus metalliredigens (strain QYMF) TaxID=293826 RepID=RRF_ALKMQ|nr:ribosome recycling factor [Alkaliphilus metalliredigens]A6TRM0.1 RecName: Full=Ribosome-recycling factor; Short=RRF; AltName: Full=Ribosome-releasing factor [Alkaliphilus metalliredigens QYMF]ABR48838.1 ribosome recycling factor [Alkaliphilus metalliredigens QYMF]
MQLEVHKRLEEKMTKTLGVLKDDFNSIRAGKANPSMLDRITVDYYGSITPLKQVASVSAPEPRLLIIQPYDPSVINGIEKALMMSDLGLNPSNDGKIIRLNIPQLTEERRKELTKVVKRVAEEGRVALRNGRRDANEQLKKMEKDSELTEDDLKQAQEEVQKITDKFNKQVDEMLVKKELEILEV